MGSKKLLQRVLGSGKVPEPIRNEKWVHACCIKPNMLGLGMTI
jgi:hypothetical protein